MEFMALGGTDYTGASCYYVKLAGKRFLLDCGRGVSGGRSFGPDYDRLLSGALTSLSELDAVLLSHGHFDHAGALPDFLAAAPGVPVYGTRMTQKLIEYLLLDKLEYRSDRTCYQMLSRSLRNGAAAEQIRPVGYCSPVRLGEVSITFFEAGHVPGASAILLQSPEGSLLYTGDFLREPTALTNGLSLPGKLRCDVMVLCGTHARHPFYQPADPLPAMQREVGDCLSAGEPMYLSVSQLTKGAETVCLLSRWFPDAPLYLEPDILRLAEKLERAGTRVLTPQCRMMRPDTPADGICIGGPRGGRGFTRRYSVGISLHETFEGCAELVKRTEPETVFLVHAPRDRNRLGDDALGARCRDTTVISPEQGHLYGN